MKAFVCLAAASAAPLAAVHAHPVTHAVAHAAPVVAHHAVHAAPVVHAVAHAAPVAGYAASDLAEAAFSLSGSNGVEGSYSMNLPYGLVQTVTYPANNVDG